MDDLKTSTRALPCVGRAAAIMEIMGEPELEIHEKTLREVFDSANLEFHAIIARLSVLFEDLRIEEYASRLETLSELDVLGKTYRQMYFLRRSIATLVEFSGAIEMLDQRPEFRLLKKSCDRDLLTRWNDAAEYFREWKKYLSERRADFGGHFDHGSSKHAINKIDPAVKGQIVVVKNVAERTGGVRLHYAMAIVEAAMTHRKPDNQGDRQWFREMFIVVRAGSNEAVKAMHTLSVMYLLEKFGRNMN